MIYPEAMEDSPVLHNEKARLPTSFFLNNLTLNLYHEKNICGQTLSRLSWLTPVIERCGFECTG